MKYPIGIQTFSEIVENGYVYVDKTALVHKLATEGKIFFLSRPRRFGKSLLLSTLESYFLGRKELFKGLALERLETAWVEHPVLRLSFSTSNFVNAHVLEESLEVFLQDAEERYGVGSSVRDLNLRFKGLLRAIHEKTGHKVVVLVDEYDKPLLDVLDQEYLSYPTDSGRRLTYEEHNRNVLKGFYGTFKDADEHLRFVLLTGVTKFSQISVFSGFNQPQDISSDTRYESLCGITKAELLSVFQEPIAAMAAKFAVSFDEMIQMLTRKYDGYHFGEAMVDIFNPFSLLNCLDSQQLRDFWFASGTPTYLVRLLQHSRENINELAGKYYEASQFVNYKADVERPLPMIYQSGYLTIKGYNPRRNTYLLDFPNEEVRQGFIEVLASGYFRERGMYTSNWLNSVSDDLEAGQVELFMKKMSALLASATYRFQQKGNPMECERYFQYTFYLILQMLGRYNTMVEKETSEGRIDCVIECPEHVYILEFKLNGSATEALQQIHDKGYAKPYAADPRQLHLLGVNFSSNSGNIEQYVAE